MDRHPTAVKDTAMKAMVMHRICRVADTAEPLISATLPIPEPGPGELLIRVSVCGVCHTELDIIEGRTPPALLPLVPGHQVVGRVAKAGPGAGRFQTGDRVGVAWIYSACGRCDRCRSGQENLCADFAATGRDRDGGYAEYMRVPENFAHTVPEALTDAKAAPLLCAGAVGFRSLRLTGLKGSGCLGFTGFGASGHLVLQLVRRRNPEIRTAVFARNAGQRRLALDLGADWAGGYDETPPEPLDAVIDTTPVWAPVKKALEVLKPGGRLVINAIRKEKTDQHVLQEFDYADHLWMEKEIKSVANVTREDVRVFLEDAARWRITPEVTVYPLSEANRALKSLALGGVRGAMVLRLDGGPDPTVPLWDRTRSSGS